MPSLGNPTLEGRPALVLAVSGYAPGLRRARAEGVDMLEARLDLFPRQDAQSVRSGLRRLAGLGLPILATFRRRSEGGGWKGPDTVRRDRLLENLDLVAAVDIELAAAGVNAAVARACRSAGKALLVSSHDFLRTPPDGVLERRFRGAKSLGADAVKVACMARSSADVLRLMAFVASHRREGIVGLSMGPLGSVSRIAAPLFGSLLTYTARPPVHGQIPLEALAPMLRALYPAPRRPQRKGAPAGTGGRPLSARKTRGA